MFKDWFKKQNIAGNNEKYIIVIGDWFIDENWLVAKHTSYSSSHTGDIHYLSKHKKLGEPMVNLCGTPEVLEVLESFNKEHAQEDKYEFIGFGAWNKNDDDILQCILCKKHRGEVASEKNKYQYLTPYTLRSLQDIKTDIDGHRLCPYGSSDDPQCAYLPALVNLANNGKTSTNKIIRCYEGYGSGRPHLLYRFDWRLPIMDSDLDYNVLKKHLDNKNIKAVIIEDHNNGVINNSTIKILIETLGDKLLEVNWYIRTKRDNPEWMRVLESELKKHHKQIRLKVIDYKLAHHKKGRRRWQYGKELGRASLEILGEMTGDKVWLERVQDSSTIVNNTQRAAILFDENLVIAKEGNMCFNIYTAPGAKQLINIGRTTVFFNALVAQDLSDEYSKLDFGKQCLKALQCAFEWSRNASEAWNAEDPRFYGEYSNALNALSKELDDSSIHKDSYDGVWSRWDASSADSAILTEDNVKKIEVWRGEGTLEGYICVGGPKKNEINKLLSSIYQFHTQKEHKHPFNCLLVASPGWGKSFLAKCMAKHFDMTYLEFSLSQMASNKNLIDCFDTICSVQNRTEKKVLVFMDEVNCKIEGNSAMGLLLSPIWEGSFLKDGKIYRLSPAVWVFASTEPISEFIDPNKGSDFVSRLNGPVIELDYLSTSHGRSFLSPIKNLKRKLVAERVFDPYKTEEYTMFEQMKGPFRPEQVYLAVSLLNEYWGPISKIQEEVIELFNKILPLNGFRSLEFFVSKFHDIQRGMVTCSNVPSVDEFKELKRHVVLPETWEKDDNRPSDKSPDNPTHKKSFIDIITIIK